MSKLNLSADRRIRPQTLKGFRDFLPQEAGARNYIIEQMKRVFESYGYEPLETPALEYAETLLGKYGKEADKLLYLFKDRGGRNVGLRYDQTVPLARVVAQYPNLTKPFKRYQIQPVWRADNPQKGRYREFFQCDIDIVGTDSALADAEIISCTLTAFKKLGFTSPVMLVNDRTIFDNLGLTKEEIIILDKLEKIGDKQVVAELKSKERKNAEEIFATIKNSQPTERLKKIFSLLKKEGFVENKDFLFVPYMARGLDYYTSTIFEIKAQDYSTSSLAGGGRFDNLIGKFIGFDIPAVGIAFGFDRMVEIILENKFLPLGKSATKVLVIVFSSDLEENSLSITSLLRKNNVNTETFLDPTAKLDKQLKYADQKGIPFVLIIGPDEVKQNMVTVKNMKTKEQKMATKEELIKLIT